MSKLFVGNLSWNTSEDDLKEHFEKIGKVKSAKIITDKATNKSKGFGFVEMESAEDANAAIDKLHEQMLGDRNLRVSLAQERQERPDRGPRGGGDRGDRGYRSQGDYSSNSRPYGKNR